MAARKRKTVDAPLTDVTVDVTAAQPSTDGRPTQHYVPFPTEDIVRSLHPTPTAPALPTIPQLVTPPEFDNPLYTALLAEWQKLDMQKKNLETSLAITKAQRDAYGKTLSDMQVRDLNLSKVRCGDVFGTIVTSHTGDRLDEKLLAQLGVPTYIIAAAKIPGKEYRYFQVSPVTEAEEATS